jgi:hypothetical protein
MGDQFTPEAALACYLSSLGADHHDIDQVLLL